MHAHKKAPFLVLYAGIFSKTMDFSLKVYANLMYNYECQPVKE